MPYTGFCAHHDVAVGHAIARCVGWVEERNPTSVAGVAVGLQERQLNLRSNPFAAMVRAHLQTITHS